MTLVLDASVAIEWFIEGDHAATARTVAQRLLEDTAVVSQLWPLEVANVLTLAARKGVISTSARAAAFDALRSMVIDVDAETAIHSWSRTLQFADLHRLTAYDASYLELATRLELPLATLDKDLAKAARAEGVTVLP